MRLLLAFVLTTLGGAALLASCGKSGETEPAETLCEPGENIFCRCPGGEAGTKTCKDDGQSFDACVTRTGPCSEIPDTTSSTTTTGGGEGGGGGGAGGSGAGGNGGGAPGQLYDACSKNEDCASGLCPMGFCTKECAKYDECTLGTGECVKVGGGLICTPICDVTSQCEGAYGQPSACGYTKAVDGTPVTTCADWLDDLALPPDGSDCSDDEDCSLGNAGTQHVCAFQACAEGCYVDSDCPPDLSCSSSGALGTCQ